MDVMLDWRDDANGFKSLPRGLAIGGLAAALLIGVAMPVQAQRGDREGEEQPEVWRDMDVPPAPVLKPEEALDSFKVAPGFRVELVASEPLIEDPVSIRWDAEGRIWAVEMRGFMPNVDGEGEDAPVGRVVVLQDGDGDGRMDQSTVFLDGLVMPRAIGLVEGGVLVGEPPNLWYCRDTNGDLKCDQKEVVYDEYGRQGPVEHTDNGLLWNIDNWMYNAKSSLRFRFWDGELVVDETHFRGQWGIDHDSYGRLYSNSNSSYLHADFVPDHYLDRNPHFDSDIGLTENIASDQDVFPIRINPGINRGYRDHMLRDDGRLARTTAISGVAVYRGDTYPESFVEDVFVPEPSGNAVAHFDISQEGVRLKGEHVTYEDDEWGRREFLASTDERFRPVDAYTGPDGHLYIVDFYRGILQHRVYVTTFLRKQILERGLDKPLGLGRIYRVVHEANDEEAAQPDLADVPGPALVECLTHPNGWWRDTAQRLLVQRRDHSAVDALQAMARGDPEPVARIHALWTLHGLDAVDRRAVFKALKADNPQVRIAAMRTGEALLDRPARDAFLRCLIMMDDLDHQAVRTQLMFTLGEVQGSRPAEDAMAELLTRFADDAFMRHAAVSGLADRELAMLQKLLEKQAWGEEKAGFSEVLTVLAETVRNRQQPDEVLALLSMVETQPDSMRWRQEALMAGLANASGSEVTLPEEPRILASIRESGISSVEEALEGIHWGESEGEGSADSTRPSNRAEELFELGKVTYQATCMPCHQPDGSGQKGLAPPLVDTQWVNGDPEILARIVLDGLAGPIEVHGETWNLVMPGHRHSPAITDEKLAGILTYIRRAWGNQADPVYPELVETVRKETEGRGGLWTVEQLKELK